MAEPVQTSSAEDRQKRIDEKTSVGVYALKQVQQTVIPLIGAGIGWLLGAGILKNARMAQWIEKRMAWKNAFGSGFEVGGKPIFVGITTGIGTMIAGMFNTYEHWRNLESEKLAVAEINTDVGNLVAQRAQFAETLNRQESFIKDMVAKGQAKPESFVERTASAEPSADVARG